MLPQLSQLCTLQLVYKKVPILHWLPRYTLHDAVSDLIAGITVGLTLMPQAIAYAALAGLGPQYGLYSAFAGSFVYIVFGTCKEVNIGPTALMSLLTLDYTHDTSPDMAVLLCFLSGCVQLMCGLLRLGFLVEFVSVPVVSGFTSAAAVIIATSQLKGLLGLQFKAESFVDTWRQLYQHIGETRKWDLCLSVFCVATLLLLRKLKDLKLGSDTPKTQTTNQKCLSKIVWFVATSRNATIVIVCASVAYCFNQRDQVPFLLTGRINAGLPPVTLPPFATSYGDHTYGFLEMCQHLGTGIFVVPIISILGNVAIAKAFSTGAMLDATQEIVTLGLCNIAGAFVRSMPVTGSFSRSAVNNASGVRTQMGGLYTGILVLLALSLLTPYFYFIPRATLSSVIICAVIFMVELSILPPIWRTNKRDLVPALVTFIACLAFGVVLGIVIGIVVDLIFVFYLNARPQIVSQKVQSSSGLDYLLVTPRSGLLFPAIDFLREKVAKSSVEHGLYIVVIDCQHVTQADFTVVKGIQSLVKDFKKKDGHIMFHNLETSIAIMMADVCGVEMKHSRSETELTQILKCLENGTESTENVKMDINLIDDAKSSTVERLGNEKYHSVISHL